MTSVPTSTIRLRVDLLNPGQFLACCGLLELADRAWVGAEGWFDERSDFFYLSPLEREPSRQCGTRALLDELKKAKLINALMSETEMNRLADLSQAIRKSKKKGDKNSANGTAKAKGLTDELDALEALWDKAKDGALALGAPFNLRLDWYLDDRAGGGHFKTWAGQQNITEIAFELKNTVDQASFDNESAELECLFTLLPCEKSLHIDAVGEGSDVDIGFSFDPLKVRSLQKRPLVELLAFVGLQRFPPRQVVGVKAYSYEAWLDPLEPQIAHAAARGFGAGRARRFEFRLLYRSKYLKSFLPAQSRGDRP